MNIKTMLLSMLGVTALVVLALPIVFFIVWVIADRVRRSPQRLSQE